MPSRFQMALDLKRLGMAAEILTPASFEKSGFLGIKSLWTEN
jgi:hypothetical protein